MHESSRRILFKLTLVPEPVSTAMTADGVWVQRGVTGKLKGVGGMKKPDLWTYSADIVVRFQFCNQWLQEAGFHFCVIVQQ